jgi:Zn-dependent protease
MYMFEVQGTPFLRRLGDLPAQAGIFLVLLNVARFNMPRRPRLLRWLTAFIWYGMYQTADTLHSVGHILSAKRAGAPMDAVVCQYGFQFAAYYNNDVTPQQHMGRAIGGPLLSTVMATNTFVLWRILRRVPIIRELLEAWFAFNAIFAAGSLVPTPTFDGSTLLRYGVGLATGDEALGDEAVQQAGFAVAAGTMLAAFILLLRGKWTLAVGLVLFAGYIVVDLLFLRGMKP